MIKEMQLRGYAKRTQSTYTRAVRQLENSFSENLFKKTFHPEGFFKQPNGENCIGLFVGFRAQVPRIKCVWVTQIITKSERNPLLKTFFFDIEYYIK